MNQKVNIKASTNIRERERRKREGEWYWSMVNCSYRKEKSILKNLKRNLRP